MNYKTKKLNFGFYLGIYGSLGILLLYCFHMRFGPHFEELKIPMVYSIPPCESIFLLLISASLAFILPWLIVHFAQAGRFEKLYSRWKESVIHVYEKVTAILITVSFLAPSFIPVLILLVLQPDKFSSFYFFIFPSILGGMIGINAYFHLEPFLKNDRYGNDELKLIHETNLRYMELVVNVSLWTLAGVLIVSAVTWYQSIASKGIIVLSDLAGFLAFSSLYVFYILIGVIAIVAQLQSRLEKVIKRIHDV